MKEKKLPAPAKNKLPANGKTTAATSSKREAGLKKAKMELNQKLKGEILNVYTEGWNAYLNGDLKTHGFHLSNNFKIIGSSESEQFNSKKSWLSYCKKTIKQFAGVIRLQNRKIKLVPAGEEVMVVENADIYVLIDKKWSFYSRIRITALLQKEKTGWKYIHQHGSLPDTRANDGEVIATRQIKKENLLLKEAVKRRTIELENKNRELEIEAALERVRARTMAMQHSGELSDVVYVLYKQMQQLGFNYGACTITLMNEVSGDTDWWMAGFTDLGYPDCYHVNYFDHPGYRAVLNAWKRKKKFASIEIKGASKKAYDEVMFSQTGFSKLPADIKTMMAGFDRVIYSMAYMRYGALSFGPSAISDEQKHILQKFAEVFEQTYTRFLDLQKAEVQSKEAQIELGLERVRARAMAMRLSSELNVLIGAVYAELTRLNISLNRCFIMIFDPETLGITWWMASGETEIHRGYFIPYSEHPAQQAYLKGWQNREERWRYVLAGDEKREWDQFLFSETEFAELPEIAKQGMMVVSKVFLSSSFNNFGCLSIGSLEPLDDASFDIMLRFAKVFDLTYTRFNDLQKAEAQAREAKIEAALEKVRSRTMAMQRSDELSEAAVLLFQQVKSFGLQSWGCGFNIWDKDEKVCTSYFTNNDGDLVAPFIIPLTEDPIFIRFFESRQKGEDFWIEEISGQREEEHYTYLCSLPGVGEMLKGRLKAGIPFPTFQIDHGVNFSCGNLLFITYEPVPEAHDIFKRFGKVFEQTYTRFLDLQKAEAQAKEAKIEAALERVRSRSMAMHKSEELGELSFELVKQVQALGIATWHCAFNIYNEDQQSSTEWGSNAEGSYPIYKTPREGIFLRYYEAGQRGETFHVEVIGEDRCADHYTYLCTLPGIGETLLKVRDSGIPFPKSQIDHVAYFKYGYLLFITFEPAPDAHDIFKRFAKVFEQTYTRFLDLKKAEVQAREAQIEAALERLRSKTMAMHNSQDVGESVVTLFDELVALGVLGVDERCGIGIMHPNEKMEAWTASKTVDGKAELTIGHIIMKSHPLLQGAYQGWIDKKETFRYILEGENKLRYYDAILNQSDYKVNRDYFSEPIRIVHTDFYFSEGCLYVFSLNQFSAESSSVLIRFASVFGQTYRRYLDLQKAEAQAREAQIEASLERVRGKAMAMHSSEDLAATIGAFYHELELFSITPRRCGVGLLNKETHMAELSTMNTTEQGKSIEVIGTLKMIGHPVLEGIYENWLLQNEYHPILRGNEIKEYYQLIRPQVAFPEYPNDAVQYGYFFYFSEGGVYAWTEKPLSEDELKIYRRFTTVLSLTYKRYKDLKDAETREMEAVKQAALDRVRADIASMRSTADLDRITPLIWKELTTLGIPFIRCGVFIMDEKENKVHTYLSTPDGRAIAAYHTPMDNSGGLVGAIDNWRRQNVFVTHWVESDFQKQADILLEQGSITTREQYLSTLPKEGFHLHFLPFRQGMLYVGSNEPLQSDALQLVRSLADAFSVAYARYEDFTKLESAKQQIEKTLVDLKQTQVQLIQSEKMASLGELTAGIAHEIQNPLNFVNNFSEVNKELLCEMAEEIEKGNLDEVKTIAKDVISNEEKINHHGKRADAIVKGMLQHSRSSSGVKEPTDINVLADEYLRLAYHGLRAKDKSFNATMKTDFDENVGNVKVIPQDLGRVILNLITNAFYVVDKKKKSGITDYEPTVSVNTKKDGDKILISVKDNGDGIPDNIKEKIFQPFFTTKPTGEGTGLGLSLSYDIVKAHGGELKVNTRVGEGTEFIIQIPV